MISIISFIDVSWVILRDCDLVLWRLEYGLSAHGLFGSLQATSCGFSDATVSQLPFLEGSSWVTICLEACTVNQLSAPKESCDSSSVG